MSIISTRSIFQGRVIDVNVERVALPNGSIAELEIVRHPGGAAIVAIDAQGQVCLLRQFRHAADGWIWELPAGKIDNREPPNVTAQRELLEEGGMTASTWESLGEYISSPGVFTEVVHLFLATGLRIATSQLEEHEVLEVHWKPFAEVLRMSLDGEVRDGKSLVGIFRAAAHLQAQNASS